MSSSQEGPVANEQTSEGNERRDSGGQDEQRDGLSVDELAYGVGSFYAIVGPVFLTMLLSALAVVFISTPESKAQGEENLSNSYIVFRGDDDDTNSAKLFQSLANGLIIVSVIGAMTFLIVLLYKYRCMKCLLGYMMLASAMLLGFLSSEMLRVALDRFHWNVDKITFAFFIFNFAVVGTFSIFFGKGSVPAYITQFYLIMSSVIVAWHLSHFDPWTAWILLILLALYDLFAVLTPCGPLKALVNLMQRDNAPEIPGLLYEANIGETRPTTAGATDGQTERTTENSAAQTNSNSDTAHSASHVDEAHLEEDNKHGSSSAIGETSAVEHETALAGSSDDNCVTKTSNLDESGPEVDDQEVVETENVADPDEESNHLLRGNVPLAIALHDRLQITSLPVELSKVEGRQWTGEQLQCEVGVLFPPTGLHYMLHAVQRDGEELRYALFDGSGKMKRVVFVSGEGNLFEDVRYRERSTGMIPLAIAKLNKLPFVEGPQPSWVRRRESEEDVPDENFSAEDLKQLVHVVFPPSGWRITEHENQRQGEETRYAIIKPDGSIRRIVFVTPEGRVFEDLREKNEASAAEERKKRRTSIKLGLGDFIFYSILVSKAALYSFTTFAACTLVILIGLGLTLLILAVHGKALPALPISIFLGVTFYLITRYLIEPWVQQVFVEGTFV